MSQQTPRFDRRYFFRLAGTTSAVGLLVACGSPPGAAQPTAAPAAAAPPTQAPAAPAATQLSAAPAATQATTAAPTTLRYVFVGGVPADLAMVQEALSSMVQQKGLNVSVQLDQLDWGAFNDKVNLMNTGGEVFDLVFTAPWINNYYQNVANGTLAPLDDQLVQYAPKLWASMPPTTWDAARVNGQIYGAINQQIFPKLFGPLIRKDIADKYAIDLAAISSFDQLTPILQQIKDGEPDLTYVFLGDNGSNLEIFGYDPIDQALGFTAVKFTDASATVVNFLTTPEARAYSERAAAWSKAGFTARDQLKQEEIDALYSAGQVAVFMSTVIKPGVEVELKNKYGAEWIAQPIAPNYLTTGGVVATLNGVPASSQHPELAVQLLELINTDPEVYNLLAKGIEGTHWTWVDKDKRLIAITEAGKSGYNQNLDWAFGNQFNAYYTDPSAVGNWERTKALNDAASPSPLLGFTFDRSPVETELAQTSEVWARVWKPIYDGTGDPAANLEQALSELQQAGSETIIAEIQRQVDAWKASKA